MKARNSKPIPERNWTPAVVTLGVTAIIAVFVIAVAMTQRTQPTQSTLAAVGAVPPPQSTYIATVVTVTPQIEPTMIGMGNCPPNWDKSDDRAVRDICAKLKADNYMKQRASEIATAEARPSVQTLSYITPGVQLPPPDYAKIIRELPYDPYKGARPPHWRSATSVWQVGALPNRDYTSWSAMYIVSRPGNSATKSTNPTLETEGLTDGLDPKYNKQWVCPQAVGEIYITNITKPDLNITDAKTPFPALQGVVYFKTKAGQTGSFNLATETWTFDTPAKTP